MYLSRMSPMCLRMACWKARCATSNAGASPAGTALSAL
jgi:hypothetical protein